MFAQNCLKEGRNRGRERVLSLSHWERFENFLVKKAGSLFFIRCNLLSLGKNFGAGDRDRTGDVQLGKLAFYR